MKLYTEEQLQESYNRGLMDGRLNNIDYSITDGFKPIELPKPMKTTMQELIDKIQYSIDVQSGVSLTETQVNTLKSVMLIAETLLEKEKEQIINAAKSCNYIGGATDIEAEEYYNQTYNQKNSNHQEVTSDTPSNYQRGWNAAQRGLLQNDAWGDTYTDNANNRPSHEELDEWIKGWKAYRHSNEIAKNK